MPTISKFLDYDIGVSAISGTTISEVNTTISMVNIGIQYRSFGDLRYRRSVMSISVYKDIVIRPTIL